MLITGEKIKSIYFVKGDVTTLMAVTQEDVAIGVFNALMLSPSVDVDSLIINNFEKGGDIGYAVTVAYFEGSGCAEIAAVFRDESTYADCIEILESKASEARMIVTDSCEVEDFDLDSDL